MYTYHNSLGMLIVPWFPQPNCYKPELLYYPLETVLYIMMVLSESWSHAIIPETRALLRPDVHAKPTMRHPDLDQLAHTIAAWAQDLHPPISRSLYEIAV